MRQIKFRVWDKEEKIMFPPATLEEIVDNIDMGLPVNITGWGCDGCNMGDQDRFVWLQYTGLKDWHGKEIYEGDIVKFTRTKNVPRWNDSIEVVENMYEIFNHCWEGGLDYEDIKVIGNIYENPELIN